MRGFGVDLADVLEEAGLPADILADRESRVAYADLGRLLTVSARLSNCGHVALLVAQNVRLVDMGLAGRSALCAETVGDALRSFVRHFAMQNTAATIGLITTGDFTRFLYAISAPDIPDTQHFQLGAMTVAFNVLQDLCGRAWHPTVVTFASRAPANLRPCHSFFRSPLRFDSDESAVVFDSHWLERPLPPVDPLTRAQTERQLKERQAESLVDLPARVRDLVRQQLAFGECSMESVAACLGMHRRTLDRWLRRHGQLYGEILESVQSELACQLLRDTDMPVAQIAESLRFSSPGNFATAFRRWTGVAPSGFRRSVNRGTG